MNPCDCCNSSHYDIRATNILRTEDNPESLIENLFADLGERSLGWFDELTELYHARQDKDGSVSVLSTDGTTPLWSPCPRGGLLTVPGTPLTGSPPGGAATAEETGPPGFKPKGFHRKLFSPLAASCADDSLLQVLDTCGDGNISIEVEKMLRTEDGCEANLQECHGRGDTSYGGNMASHSLEMFLANEDEEIIQQGVMARRNSTDSEVTDPLHADIHLDATETSEVADQLPGESHLDATETSEVADQLPGESHLDATETSEVADQLPGESHLDATETSEVADQLPGERHLDATETGVQCILVHAASLDRSSATTSLGQLCRKKIQQAHTPDCGSSESGSSRSCSNSTTEVEQLESAECMKSPEGRRIFVHENSLDKPSEATISGKLQNKKSQYVQDSELSEDALRESRSSMSRDCRGTSAEVIHLVPAEGVDATEEGGSMVDYEASQDTSSTLTTSGELCQQAQASGLPRSRVGARTSDLPRSRVGARTSDLPRSRVGARTSDLPRSRIGARTSDLPRSRVGARTSDLPRSRVGAQTSHLPRSQVGAQSSHLPRSQVGAQSSHLPRSQVGAQSSHLPRSQVGAQTSDLSGSRVGAQSLHLSGSQVGAQTSDLSRNSVSECESSMRRGHIEAVLSAIFPSQESPKEQRRAAISGHGTSAKQQEEIEKAVFDSCRRQEELTMTTKSDSSRQKEGQTSTTKSDSSRQKEGQTSTTKLDSSRQKEGQTSTTKSDSSRQKEGQTSTTKSDSSRQKEGQTSTTKSDSSRQKEGQTSTTKSDSSRQKEGQTSTTKSAHTIKEEKKTKIVRIDNSEQEDNTRDVGVHYLLDHTQVVAASAGFLELNSVPDSLQISEVSNEEEQKSEGAEKGKEWGRISKKRQRVIKDVTCWKERCVSDDNFRDDVSASLSFDEDLATIDESKMVDIEGEVADFSARALIVQSVSGSPACLRSILKDSNKLRGLARKKVRFNIELACAQEMDDIVPGLGLVGGTSSALRMSATLGMSGMVGVLEASSGGDQGLRVLAGAFQEWVGGASHDSSLVDMPSSAVEQDGFQAVGSLSCFCETSTWTSSQTVDYSAAESVIPTQPSQTANTISADIYLTVSNGESSLRCSDPPVAEIPFEDHNYDVYSFDDSFEVSPTFSSQVLRSSQTENQEVLPGTVQECGSILTDEDKSSNILNKDTCGQGKVEGRPDQGIPNGHVHKDRWFQDDWSKESRGHSVGDITDFSLEDGDDEELCAAAVQAENAEIMSMQMVSSSSSVLTTTSVPSPSALSSSVLTTTSVPSPSAPSSSVLARTSVPSPSAPSSSVLARTSVPSPSAPSSSVLARTSVPSPSAPSSSVLARTSVPSPSAPSSSVLARTSVPSPSAPSSSVLTRTSVPSPSAPSSSVLARTSVPSPSAPSSSVLTRTSVPSPSAPSSSVLARTSVPSPSAPSSSVLTRTSVPSPSAPSSSVLARTSVPSPSAPSSSVLARTSVPSPSAPSSSVLARTSVPSPSAPSSSVLARTSVPSPSAPSSSVLARTSVPSPSAPSSSLLARTSVPSPSAPSSSVLARTSVPSPSAPSSSVLARTSVPSPSAPSSSVPVLARISVPSPSAPSSSVPVLARTSVPSPSAPSSSVLARTSVPSPSAPSSSVLARTSVPSPSAPSSSVLARTSVPSPSAPSSSVLARTSVPSPSAPSSSLLARTSVPSPSSPALTSTSIQSISTPSNSVLIKTTSPSTASEGLTTPSSKPSLFSPEGPAVFDEQPFPRTVPKEQPFPRTLRSKHKRFCYPSSQQIEEAWMDKVTTDSTSSMTCTVKTLYELERATEGAVGVQATGTGVDLNKIACVEACQTLDGHKQTIGSGATAVGKSLMDVDTGPPRKITKLLGFAKFSDVFQTSVRDTAVTRNQLCLSPAMAEATEATRNTSRHSLAKPPLSAAATETLVTGLMVKEDVPRLDENNEHALCKHSNVSISRREGGHLENVCKLMASSSTHSLKSCSAPRNNLLKLRSPSVTAIRHASVPSPVTVSRSSALSPSVTMSTNSTVPSPVTVPQSLALSPSVTIPRSSALSPYVIMSTNSTVPSPVTVPQNSALSPSVTRSTNSSPVTVPRGSALSPSVTTSTNSSLPSPVTVPRNSALSPSVTTSTNSSVPPPITVPTISPSPPTAVVHTTSAMPRCQLEKDVYLTSQMWIQSEFSQMLTAAPGDETDDCHLGNVVEHCSSPTDELPVCKTGSTDVATICPIGNGATTSNGRVLGDLDDHSSPKQSSSGLGHLQTPHLESALKSETSFLVDDKLKDQFENAFKGLKQGNSRSKFVTPFVSRSSQDKPVCLPLQERNTSVSKDQQQSVISADAVRCSKLAEFDKLFQQMGSGETEDAGSEDETSNVSEGIITNHHHSAGLSIHASQENSGFTSSVHNRQGASLKHDMVMSVKGLNAEANGFSTASGKSIGVSENARRQALELIKKAMEETEGEDMMINKCYRKDHMALLAEESAARLPAKRSSPRNKLQNKKAFLTASRNIAAVAGVLKGKQHLMSGSCPKDIDPAVASLSLTSGGESINLADLEYSSTNPEATVGSKFACSAARSMDLASDQSSHSDKQNMLSNSCKGFHPFSPRTKLHAVGEVEVQKGNLEESVSHNQGHEVLCVIKSGSDKAASQPLGAYVVDGRLTDDWEDDSMFRDLMLMDGEAAFGNGGRKDFPSGSLAVSGCCPAIPGGCPANSGDFPANSGDFPANSGDFPLNSGDFPLNSGDFPANSGDFPTNSGDFPVNSGYCPTVSIDYPTFSSDCPAISKFSGHPDPVISISSDMQVSCATVAATSCNSQSKISGSSVIMSSCSSDTRISGRSGPITSVVAATFHCLDKEVSGSAHRGTPRSVITSDNDDQIVNRPETCSSNALPAASISYKRSLLSQETLKSSGHAASTASSEYLSGCGDIMSPGSTVLCKDRMTVCGKGESTSAVGDSTRSFNIPSGFSTASGFRVSISEQATEHARSFLNDNTQAESVQKLMPKVTYGFSTASGSKVSVSGKALEHARSFLNDNTEAESVQEVTYGFSTASGSKVSVSGKSLQRARSFLNDDDKAIGSDVQVRQPSLVPCGLSQKPGQFVECSESPNSKSGLTMVTSRNLSDVYHTGGVDGSEKAQMFLEKCRSFCVDSEVVWMSDPTTARPGKGAESGQHDLSMNVIRDNQKVRNSCHQPVPKASSLSTTNLASDGFLQSAEGILGIANNSRSSINLESAESWDVSSFVMPVNVIEHTGSSLKAINSPGTSTEGIKFSHQGMLNKGFSLASGSSVSVSGKAVKHAEFILADTTGETNNFGGCLDGLARNIKDPKASGTDISKTSTSVEERPDVHRFNDHRLAPDKTRSQEIGSGSGCHSPVSLESRFKSEGVRPTMDKVVHTPLRSTCEKIHFDRRQMRGKSLNAVMSGPAAPEQRAIPHPGSTPTAGSFRPPCKKARTCDSASKMSFSDTILVASNGNSKNTTSKSSFIPPAHTSATTAQHPASATAAQHSAISAGKPTVFMNGKQQNCEKSKDGFPKVSSAEVVGDLNVARFDSLEVAGRCKSLTAAQTSEDIFKSSKPDSLTQMDFVSVTDGKCSLARQDPVADESVYAVTMETGSDDSSQILSDFTLEEARMKQEKIIRAKKKARVRPLGGRWFESRKRKEALKTLTSLGLTPKMDVRKGELLRMGVSCSTLEVSSASARDFRFDLHRFYPVLGPGILVGDGALLVPDKHGLAGAPEFYRAFVTLDGVDPNLIDKAWLENHYRWIVWKLAAYELCFPGQFAGRSLTPEIVMLQLKYRYDREIDGCHRSAIKKILERDDTPHKRMVLCVAAVTKMDGAQFCVELTDGWYSIPAHLDSCLTELVARHRLGTGDKIVTSGAELIGCPDGCSPLEINEGVALKLCGNSTRPAPRYARLGYSVPPSGLCVPVYSLSPSGGVVSSVDIVVCRKYPVMYMEKLPDGSCVFRSSEEEDKARQRHEEQYQTQVERVYMSLQKDMEDVVTSHKSGGVRASWKHVESLWSGQELQSALEEALNPEELQQSFSSSQMDRLLQYRQAEMDRKQQEMNRKLQEVMAETCKPRNVAAVQKLRVSGCCPGDLDAHGSCLLVVWQPGLEWMDVEEGQRYKLFNLSVSSARGRSEKGKVTLTANRQTRIQARPIGEHLLDSVYERRQAWTVSRLLSDRPYGNEFDFVGIVIQVLSATRPGSPTCVLAADNDQDILCIKFWTSSQVTCLKPGQCFLACNLILSSSTQYSGSRSVQVTAETRSDLTCISVSGNSAGGRYSDTFAQVQNMSKNTSLVRDLQSRIHSQPLTSGSCQDLRPVWSSRLEDCNEDFPPEMLQKIFAPMSQVSSSTCGHPGEENSGGSGVRNVVSWTRQPCSDQRRLTVTSRLSGSSSLENPSTSSSGAHCSIGDKTRNCLFSIEPVIDQKVKSGNGKVELDNDMCNLASLEFADKRKSMLRAKMSKLLAYESPSKLSQLPSSSSPACGRDFKSPLAKKL